MLIFFNHLDEVNSQKKRKKYDFLSLLFHHHDVMSSLRRVFEFEHNEEFFYYSFFLFLFLVRWKKNSATRPCDLLGSINKSQITWLLNASLLQDGNCSKKTTIFMVLSCFSSLFGRFFSLDSLLLLLFCPADSVVLPRPRYRLTKTENEIYFFSGSARTLPPFVSQFFHFFF